MKGQSGRAVLSLSFISLVALALLSQQGSGPTALAATTVTATDFYVPAGSDPWGTAVDSSGNIWVAIPGCDPSPTCSTSTPPGIIAEYSPSSSSWIATYQLPAGYTQALFLAFDSSGNLWFPLFMGNSIGMLNPATGAVQQWTVPTANAGPWDIVIDHNGIIWFTEHYVNQIGRFDPSTDTFQEFATPASNSQPYGITVDSSNNIWFTENNSSVALIAEYTTGGVLNEYKIRNTTVSGLTPHLITLDPNGNVWWSEGFVGMIGELVVSQASPGTNNGVTEYAYPQPCSSCGAHTSGIGVDGYGNVWLDDSLQSIFASFPDSGTGSFSEYNTPTSYSHPHDGLRLDGQNRIWFDEEFANKLAETVQSGLPTATPPATSTSTPVATATSTPTGTGTPTPTGTPTATSTPSATPTVNPTPVPVLGSVLAQDSFQRPNQTYWGTAADGQVWGGDANSNAVFSINSDSGQVVNATTSYNAVLGPTATDAQVLFTGSMSSYSRANLGAVLRWADGNDWYKAYIDGHHLVVQKMVGGKTTILANAPFSAAAGTSYSLRFQVFGSTLSASVWQTGTTEPATWMVTTSDSTFSSGRVGLRMLVPLATSASYTSFVAYSVVSGSGATPTPTSTVAPTATATATSATTPTPTSAPAATSTPTSAPTPTGTAVATATNTPTPTLAATATPAPTGTPTASATSTPTPTATSAATATSTATPTPTSSSGTVIAQDSFQRPNQTHWGTASDGLAWGGDANSNSVFSINSDRGQVASTSTSYSAVLGPSATNGQVLFSGGLSSYTSANIGSLLRWTDGNDWYKAYIDGSNLVLQKRVSGTFTTLASVPFAASAGTSYSLRFQASGSTLSARVWQTGTTEPTNWMVTASDTSLTSGYCGLRMLSQGGTASYTSFVAYSLP